VKYDYSMILYIPVGVSAADIEYMLML